MQQHGWKNILWKQSSKQTILHEQRSKKDPQQNISTSNSTTYQKNHTSWLPETFLSYSRLAQYSKIN